MSHIVRLVLRCPQRITSNSFRQRCPRPSKLNILTPKQGVVTQNWNPHFSDAVKNAKIEEEKDKMLTVPNFLSVSRIVLTPYIAHLIMTGEYNWALALFGYAGLTDMLDGYIARNFKGQSSMLGSFLDPLADKILVTTLFFSLTYVDIIPAPLTSLVISRDVLLVFAGFYIRYMSILPPFTFRKYFDMTQPLAQIQPTTISKVNTLVQLALVGGALVAPSFQLVDHPLFQGLCLVTAGTTFASACSYAFMKDTYKFKNRSYDHQFGKKLTAFAIFMLFNLGFVYYMPVKNETKKLSKEIEKTE